MIPGAGTDRLRVVIAWDSTASNCNWPTSDCTSDTLDADLDLEVRDQNGTLVGLSDTWDSSWELCDIATTPGSTYAAYVRQWSTNASYTYLGVAWSAYSDSAE
jgi:hypothetical protein